MGLITLLNNPSNFKFYTGQGYSGNGDKSSQKSLKYGNDRIGGGNSGQPYITTAIPDDISSYIGTTDFLLRGGINAVRDSAEDIKRLSKMFVDTKSPNGLLFIAKQQLLSRTAVRTQTSGILNEGIYSPLNTLAEAGVIAFGGHLNKQGLNPFADTGAYSNNENLYDVKVKSSQPLAENRLYNLYNLTSNSTNGTKKNGITLNNGINVMTYTGGPGSDLGIGSTGIRYSKTSKTFLSQPSKNSSFANNTWVYNSSLINAPFPPSVIIPFIQQGPQPDPKGTKASPNIQDFRAVLRTQIESLKQDGRTSTEIGATPNAPDYNTQNYELRTGLGQPGQRAGKSYADYSKGVEGIGANAGKSPYLNINLTDKTGKNIGSAKSGLDRINSMPIYRSQDATSSPDANDLCSFRIAIIDNNDPSFKTFLHFRAYLDNISDVYNADWASFKYLGRGENFYNYTGFTRQMSLSWTVFASSKEELTPMYTKLNYLASTLAPDYSPAGYMRGNLAQLTIGGYVYEQPGIITGLTYGIEETSPWEIGINSGVQANTDYSVKQLPHMIKVSGFNFIPIQQFIPSKQTLTFTNKNAPNTGNVSDDTGFVDGFGTQRFISLADVSGSLYGDVVTANS